MAVLTCEQLLEKVKTRIGESTSDDDLTLLEDITDSLGSVQSTEQEDWKKKYEANDAEWRKKYRDRFFNSPADITDPLDPNPDTRSEEEKRSEEIKLSDLFKEV